MFRALVMKQIDALERQFGEPMDYVRKLYDTSRRAFWAFARFGKNAHVRKAMPPGPYYVAAIVATRAEDCGPCVQIGVNQALKEGVPAEVIRAVLDRRVDELAPELADAYRFAEAVVEARQDPAEERERLSARFGEEAVSELAWGVAAVRIFPTLKRGLGYARSCALVEVHV